MPSEDDFQLLTLLGKGFNCTCPIYLARDKKTTNLVAIKKINIDLPFVSLSELKNEVAQFWFLSHPNIHRLLESFVTNHEIWMVSPLKGYGSCRDILEANFTEGLPDLATVFILSEILKALIYLHSSGVIHRSVKASHILISHDGEVTLTGLRSAIHAPKAHGIPPNFESVLMWASPELLAQNLTGYTAKTDIYSLGLTGCELMSGLTPFDDLRPTEMFIEKLRGALPLVAMEAISPKDAGPSERSSSLSPALLRKKDIRPKLVKFIQICLTFNPKDRPGSSELAQHAVFKFLKKRQISLPELLHPIQPISETAAFTGNSGQITEQPPDIDGVTTEMTRQVISKIEWAF